MAQYVVKKGDTLWAIAQRLLGNGARWKELGYGGDPNKMPVGTVLNYGGGEAAPAPTPAAAAPAADPLDAYKKLISDWYAQKPTTPGTFQYTPEQAAADKLTVGQEYKPFYQEQATQSGDAFSKTMANARAGFSRRGLWGAAGGTQNTTDPATGLEYTTSAAPDNTGGPVSGLRQVGEADINKSNDIANTAFGRAYTEAVAGGVQNRQNEAYDVYSKTIRQPYEDQYKAWQDRLAALTAGVK